MVEYSLQQLMGVCCSIMEFCEQQKLPSEDLDLLRVRLSDPNPDGSISFDLGLPNTWRVPMS